MRVAIACLEDDTVADFKDASVFALHDIEDDKVVLSQTVSVRKDWYMSVAEFLAEQDVDALICNGIGKGAVLTFREGRIKVYGKVEGDAGEALRSYINGTLNFDPLAGM